jgi:nucleotide-binding universal stress UspA family protein
MRQPTITGEFRSIVCGIDFSVHSAMALRYAAALARTNTATVTAFFAIDPLLSEAAASAYDTGRLVDTAHEQLQRFVRTTLGTRAGSGVRCIVEVDRPERAILSALRRLDADLLVVGTHGLHGLKRVLFGSTTAAVLRRSHVPVLAVPRSCRKPARDWPRGPAVAVVNYDLRAAAEAAAAGAVARSYRSTLTIVHAIPDLRLPLWLRLDKRALNRSRIEAAQKWLQAQTRPGGARETRVLVGETADVVARFTTRQRSRLLVLPAIRPAAVSRFVEGTAAYRLLQQVRCPMLVLRTDAAIAPRSRRSGATATARGRARRRVAEAPLHRVA